MLSAGFCFFAGIEKWLMYGLFAFFSTLAVYNGQRLFKAEKSKHTPWLLWVKRHEKKLFLLIVVCSLVSIVLLFLLQQFNLYALLTLGITGLISVFYVIKLGKRNLREIPYIKIHLIAVTWTIILVLFPLLNEGSKEFGIGLVLSHYLYVIAVTIPFDIRDIKYDLPSQKTIPQVLGILKAKFLSILLLIAFFTIMIALVPALKFNVLFYFSVLIQIMLVVGMNEKRSDLYCAGAIDGSIALLGLSYFLI